MMPDMRRLLLIFGPEVGTGEGARLKTVKPFPGISAPLQFVPRALLELAAAALDELLDEGRVRRRYGDRAVVIAPGAPPVLPTTDVDVAVEVTTRAAFHEFEAKLRAQYQGSRVLSDESIGLVYIGEAWTCAEVRDGVRGGSRGQTCRSPQGDPPAEQHGECRDQSVAPAGRIHSFDRKVSKAQLDVWGQDQVALVSRLHNHDSRAQLAQSPPGDGRRSEVMDVAAGQLADLLVVSARHVRRAIGWSLETPASAPTRTERFFAV